MPITLSLSIQYAVSADHLPRWRLRHWAEQALRAASKDMSDPPQKLILTLRLVDEEEGRTLNRLYRERDYATNVLTFQYDPMPDDDSAWMADIVLCIPVLVREAHEQQKTILDHAAHLCVHGVLHALGYDHMDDEEALEMETLETTILQHMKIQDPYQDRISS
ncbi:rRNA maturation RNase YbeY [Orrella sp. 11846]|uniref:rRNA maturation RNase YbeY n=1 Tax=Orrella sp. 11846 TaxID=3409913 RepID=UPI003B593A8F